MSKGRGGGAKGATKSGPRRGGGERSLPSGLTRRQRRRLAWAGVALVAVLGVGAAGWWWTARLPGEFVPSLGNAHIQAANTPHEPYNSDPPTSGPHLPDIAPWGVHTRPVDKEHQVHNLEDGGVIVSYRPDCADRVLTPLRTVVDRYPDRVILAPYPGLSRCIALTAWTRIDTFDEPDERRLIRFIETYRGIDHHPPR